MTRRSAAKRAPDDQAGEQGTGEDCAENYESKVTAKRERPPTLQGTQCTLLAAAGRNLEQAVQRPMSGRRSSRVRSAQRLAPGPWPPDSSRLRGGAALTSDPISRSATSATSSTA